jgi:CRP-like cAMP-binding protein
VAGTAEEISVPAGETIMSVAATPNALYVIRHGTVRALIEGGKAPPVMFGTGETIGVGPFIDGGPAGGTVIALERVDLLMIRSAKLADALVRNPEAGHQLYRAIARSLAGRLRRAVGMIAFSREHDTRS